MVSQEVTPSNFWAPDPQLHSNVELTNGRPDFETILKGIQVSTMSCYFDLLCQKLLGVECTC